MPRDRESVGDNLTKRIKLLKNPKKTERKRTSSDSTTSSDSSPKKSHKKSRKKDRDRHHHKSSGEVSAGKRKKHTKSRKNREHCNERKKVSLPSCVDLDPDLARDILDQEDDSDDDFASFRKQLILKSISSSSCKNKKADSFTKTDNSSSKRIVSLCESPKKDKSKSKGDRSSARSRSPKKRKHRERDRSSSRSRSPKKRKHSESRSICETTADLPLEEASPKSSKKKSRNSSSITPRKIYLETPHKSKDKVTSCVINSSTKSNEKGSKKVILLSSGEEENISYTPERNSSVVGNNIYFSMPQKLRDRLITSQEIDDNNKSVIDTSSTKLSTPNHSTKSSTASHRLNLVSEQRKMYSSTPLQSRYRFHIQNDSYNESLNNSQSVEYEEETPRKNDTLNSSQTSILEESSKTPNKTSQQSIKSKITFVLNGKTNGNCSVFNRLQLSKQTKFSNSSPVSNDRFKYQLKNDSINDSLNSSVQSVKSLNGSRKRSHEEANSCYQNSLFNASTDRIEDNEHNVSGVSMSSLNSSGYCWNQDYLNKSVTIHPDVIAEYQAFMNTRYSTDYGNLPEICQDLLAMSPDYSIAHCVGEDMLMSSGIAVQFRRRFGHVGKLLNQRQKTGGLAFLENEGSFVYYLVTKRLSKGKPTYMTLLSSLLQLRDHVIQNEVKLLAVPKLGCGLDKLEWSEVKPLIGYVFYELDVNVVCANLDVPVQRHRIPCPVQETSLFSSSSIKDAIHIYFSSADGKLSQEEERIRLKFDLDLGLLGRGQFLGQAMAFTFDEDYLIYFCVVRKRINDAIDYAALENCIFGINRSNRISQRKRLFFQAVQEEDDDCANEKILNVVRNMMQNVTVSIGAL